MSEKDESKKPEKSLNFLGSTWFPYVVRNMSFWHMYANFPGYNKYFPDFGIATGLDVVSITLNGTHTHVFVRDPNFSEVGELLRRKWVSKGGAKEISRLFKKYAKELKDALQVCNKNLTIENWRKFVESYERYTVALNVTAIFGRTGASLLSNELLKLGFAEIEIPKIISIATYPNKHTPLFSSRLDLYKMAIQSKEKKWSDVVRTKALKKWLEKYQHIPINFCDDPWTIEDAQKQLAEIESGNPVADLKRLESDHKARVREAGEMLKRIKDRDVTQLAKAIAKATILNEFRKNVFCKAWFDIRPILLKAVKKGGSSNWRDGFYLNADEMGELLFGEPFSLVDVIKNRSVIGHSVVGGAIKLLPENDLKQFTEYIHSLLGKPVDNLENYQNVKEIKGYSASRGKVSGVAKVIFGTQDFWKINSGDILVAQATSVEFVPVMQKASAFVTNEGGITSHASIVSREMGKPCIIGTKIATKVLKDGDIVEVDADNGVVRILKR